MENALHTGEAEHQPEEVVDGHGMFGVGQLHNVFVGEDGLIWVYILISSADKILTSQLQNTKLDFFTSVGRYVSFILISTA